MGPRSKSEVRLGRVVSANFGADRPRNRPWDHSNRSSRSPCRIDNGGRGGSCRLCPPARPMSPWLPLPRKTMSQPGPPSPETTSHGSTESSNDFEARVCFDGRSGTSRARPLVPRRTSHDPECSRPRQVSGEPFGPPIATRFQRNHKTVILEFPTSGTGATLRPPDRPRPLFPRIDRSCSGFSSRRHCSP